MNTPAQQLKKMYKLLDELVSAAKKLSELSEQVVSQDDLIGLQLFQEDLLKEISNLDLSLKNYPFRPEEQKIFHEKLTEFKNYNAIYIKNLNSSHGLIQFDANTLKSIKKKKTAS